MEIKNTPTMKTNLLDFAEEVITCSISDDPSSFTIISKNLYKYPLFSAVRELLSNGRDAHVKSNIEAPIELNVQEKSIQIRDYGESMSHQFIKELYSVYYKSDKRKDNNGIGGFGLGSKSILGYVDTFVLKCCQNYEERTYMISFDEASAPTIALLSTQKADYQQGTTLEFQVKNELDSIDLLKSLYYTNYFEFFDVKVQINVSALITERLNESIDYSYNPRCDMYYEPHNARNKNVFNNFIESLNQHNTLEAYGFGSLQKAKNKGTKYLDVSEEGVQQYQSLTFKWRSQFGQITTFDTTNRPCSLLSSINEAEDNYTGTFYSRRYREGNIITLSIGGIKYFIDNYEFMYKYLPKKFSTTYEKEYHLFNKIMHDSKFFITLIMNIGEVDFVAGRDSLSITNKTQMSMQNVVINFVNTFLTSFADFIEQTFDESDDILKSVVLDNFFSDFDANKEHTKFGIIFNTALFESGFKFVQPVYITEEFRQKYSSLELHKYSSCAGKMHRYQVIEKDSPINNWNPERLGCYVNNSNIDNFVVYTPLIIINDIGSHYKLKNSKEYKEHRLIYVVEAHIPKEIDKKEYTNYIKNHPQLNKIKKELRRFNVMLMSELTKIESNKNKKVEGVLEGVREIKYNSKSIDITKEFETQAGMYYAYEPQKTLGIAYTDIAEDTFYFESSSDGYELSKSVMDIMMFYITRYYKKNFGDDKIPRFYIIAKSKLSRIDTKSQHAPTKVMEILQEEMKENSPNSNDILSAKRTLYKKTDRKAIHDSHTFSSSTLMMAQQVALGSSKDNALFNALRTKKYRDKSSMPSSKYTIGRSFYVDYVLFKLGIAELFTNNFSEDQLRMNKTYKKIHGEEDKISIELGKVFNFKMSFEENIKNTFVSYPLVEFVEVPYKNSKEVFAKVREYIALVDASK